MSCVMELKFSHFFVTCVVTERERKLLHPNTRISLPVFVVGAMNSEVWALAKKIF